MKLNKHVNK